MQSVSILREQLAKNILEIEQKIQQIAVTTASCQPIHLPNYEDDEVMVVDKKDFILGEQYYNETFKLC